MNLRSDLPFWLLRNGLTHTYPGLDANLSCDALVIGGGISGALLIQELSSRGIDCALVDRRHVAFGSTSASTGLLQYEIDKSLVELIQAVGQAHAERAYLLGVEAIEQIERVAGTECGFKRRPSILLARHRSDRKELFQEFEARRSAGLDVQWLDQKQLEAEYGIKRPGAIRSAVAGEVDPYCLSHRLLQMASKNGARIYDRTEITHYTQESGGVVAHTAKKIKIGARRVFFATGYETQNFLPKDIVKISSTYAFVSEPVSSFGWWSERSLVWETGQAYLYARTTSDMRILVGGLDDEMQSGSRRDARVEAKTKRLASDFRKLHRRAPDFEVAFSWAGAFGQTKDGLAYIGAYEKFPRGYFALGFGGNGITFSAMAAKILADLCEGKTNTDAEIFAFNR